MKITKSQASGKHTISNLTDDDLQQMYYSALDNNVSLARKIKQHLIDCVTDEDLEDFEDMTAQEYITNWLDGENVVS